jgi:tRNA (guanine-N7-)-methyltransferase
MTRGPLLRPEPAGAEFLTLLTPPDWTAIFGSPGALEVEIGSGAGAFALGHAARHPEVRYLAIEWRKKYARELEHRARARGLSNLRVVEADARAVIPRLFAPGSVAAIHLQFPDPWWKRAHRKRGILTPGFAALLLGLAGPGAVFDLRHRRALARRGDARHPGGAGWHNPLRGPGAFHPADPEEVPSSRERRYLESGEPVYRRPAIKR